MILGSEDFTNAFQDQLIPDEFNLFQNYPNPFNLTTYIRYGLPVDTKISLSLFDILGREIIILDKGFKKVGYHSIKWDGQDNNGNDLTSGIYFYKLDAHNYSITKKLLLLK